VSLSPGPNLSAFDFNVLTSCFSTKKKHNNHAGDINPQRWQEMLFNCLVMLTSDVLYASLIGSVAVSMSNANAASSLYHRRRLALKTYLQYRQVVKLAVVCCCWCWC
jgi:hypothetical protein